MIILLFCLIFFNAYSMWSTNSLGSLNKLPPQLIEQMPLYIADVSKDADEAVQTLIQLSRVNKYCAALISRYFNESENVHLNLYDRLSSKESWQKSKPSTFILFGMKAINGQNWRWTENVNDPNWRWAVNDKIRFHRGCFEYAIHANKDIIVTQIDMTELFPLESRNPDVCVLYRKGTPLLQIAIEKHNPLIVKRLLDLKAYPKILVLKEGEDMNLLTFAKQKGSPEIITMLEEAINSYKFKSKNRS